MWTSPAVVPSSRAAARGIGGETARALSAAGAGVTLAVRNVDAGRRAAAAITARTGNPDVSVGRIELTDRASVWAFAASWDGPLDILVSNAGIMALPELVRTPQGWESQFAINHLGHFALALALHDALTAAGDARIVSVSSSAHRRSPVVFEDIHFQHRPYEAWSAYGQSKTANVLFAVEATKRWAADGITANAVGGIRTTLQQYQPELYAGFPWRSVEAGASTLVLLAASPLLAGIGGRYFEDNNEAAVTSDPDNPRGVRPYAIDPNYSNRLWELSLEMLAS